MATQRRSWLARIGVVAIVAVGALVGVTTPAFAAPNGKISGVDLTPDQVAAGQDAELKFKVKNDGDTAATFTVVVDTSSDITGSCIQGCNHSPSIAPGAEWTPPGQIKIRGKASPGVSVRIKVTWPGGGLAEESKQLTVQAAAQSVGRIQGVVRNVADNKPIKGAVVMLVDGAGKSHQATADGNGIYTFEGSERKIAPGVIAITAIKAPFQMVGGGVARTLTLAAGQAAVPFDLSMEDPAVSSPSPTPVTETTPTAIESPTSTLEAVGETAPADEDGMDSMTLIMIIVGGLLVALGVGAIVLLLVRRNGDDDEEEEDEPVRGRPGPRGPAGAPQSGAGYRPTSPAGYGQPPYGARPADPTMVGNPGYPPQQRGPQPPPGYGAAPTQQWSPQQTQGYGGPPQSGGGYGQPGYGGQQYDETTHYAGPTSGSGGYGQQPAYGQSSYGQGAGYDQNGYAPPQGGYAQADGYGADPYGGQPGYQQDPYGGQPQQPGYGDDRRNRGDRRLDWLDD